MNHKKEFKRLLNIIKTVRAEAQLPNRNEDIADILGYNRTYLSGLTGIAGKVTEDHIKLLKLHFPFLSENKTKSYIQDRRDQKNNHAKEPVPVYGGFSSLGNIVVYDDENLKNEVIGTLPPNIFPNCDYAEKAKGDSMYPLIMNQALLVGKRCTAKGISYGEKYIIKTKDGLDTTKFVHPVLDDNKRKVEGKVLLVAHNKSVPPQEIDIADIVFSCRVHWIVNPT